MSAAQGVTAECSRCGEARNPDADSPCPACGEGRLDYTLHAEPGRIEVSGARASLNVRPVSHDELLAPYPVRSVGSAGLTTAGVAIRLANIYIDSPWLTGAGVALMIIAYEVGERRAEETREDGGEAG